MKKFNFYKITTLVLSLALIVTVALTTMGTVSAHGRGCQGVPASVICVTVDGQQINLQEYITQQQQSFQLVRNVIEGIVCRIDYLSTEAGGFFGVSIGELRSALQYLFPNQQFQWTEFPTPPTPEELGDWCNQ